MLVTGLLLLHSCKNCLEESWPWVRGDRGPPHKPGCEPLQCRSTPCGFTGGLGFQEGRKQGSRPGLLQATSCLYLLQSLIPRWYPQVQLHPVPKVGVVLPQYSHRVQPRTRASDTRSSQSTSEGQVWCTTTCFAQCPWGPTRPYGKT